MRYDLFGMKKKIYDFLPGCNNELTEEELRGGREIKDYLVVTSHQAAPKGAIIFYEDPCNIGIGRLV